MIVTKQLADMIVKKTKELTQMNMNVMDKEGVIISSSDPERIGKLHEGAIEVVRTGEEIIISSEMTNRWAGTKPGINMPILFHNEIIGVIGITGQEADVIPFGRAVKMMTEMLLQQSYLTEQIEMKERAKAYLVHEMISGIEHSSMDILQARGQLLGIDLTLPRSIMIIQLGMNDRVSESFNQSYYRLMDITQLFRSPKQTLLAQFGHDRWVVITELSAYRNEQHAKKDLIDISAKIMKTISDRLQTDARIALGKLCKDVNELGRSFHELLHMLEFACKMPIKEPIIHIDDASLEMILSEISDTSRERMIEEELGELIHYPDLIDTLQAFYDCDMNYSETARTMGIHRNTLMYRLDRIDSFLKASPKQFRQAVRTQLAILLYKLNM
ncbi:sugar diacid recognition domain-containing protein [Paenibacillus sediminis]|uniref:Carbohydrate diacid regulator n=1 Tax=Paenibacillus sediminis TaxID=664909 RepID=A0ABS4H4Y1_9BACL|nr:sugar diacid recognition domain-containing protein [Paenibacillus sediminis]MBP1937576.1 carbohydrate diacid regulator [Paenibacillus sediminis]